MGGFAETLVWWAVCVGLWILTLSSVNIQDVVVAAVLAVPCAVAARAGRAVTSVRWRPRAEWWRWAASLPLLICADTVRAFAVFPRFVGKRAAAGEWQEVRLPADEPKERAVARRALAAVTLSASPGALVIDSPPDGPLLVHTLPSGSDRPLRMVAR